MHSSVSTLRNNVGLFRDESVVIVAPPLTMTLHYVEEEVTRVGLPPLHPSFKIKTFIDNMYHKRTIIMGTIVGWLLVMGSYDPQLKVVVADVRTTYYETQLQCEASRDDFRITDSWKPIFEKDGKQFRIWCEPIQR
jgi:hypothetical protein